MSDIYCRKIFSKSVSVAEVAGETLKRERVAIAAATMTGREINFEVDGLRIGTTTFEAGSVKKKLKGLLVGLLIVSAMRRSSQGDQSGSANLSRA